MEYENCMKCPFHKLVNDPDPFDDFCDDDMAIQCIRTAQQPVQDTFGRYQPTEPMVTVSCRPYKLKEEAECPEWCPLKKEAAARELTQVVQVIHRHIPDIYDFYTVGELDDGTEVLEQLPSRGSPDNVLKELAVMSAKRPIRLQFVDESLTGPVTLEVIETTPDGKAYVKIVNPTKEAKHENPQH